MALRVLLVDDHRLFREGLRHLLLEGGFEVVGEAADGAEGLALAASAAPDLVLMDLNMPRLNGMEATRLLKVAHPDLPVVILTASETDEDLFERLPGDAWTIHVGGGASRARFRLSGPREVCEFLNAMCAVEADTPRP